MANPSKNLTFNTRLRLTDTERAKADDIATWHGEFGKPLSMNDALRLAITTTWDALPAAARTARPAPLEGQTTIEMETDQ